MKVNYTPSITSRFILSISLEVANCEISLSFSNSAWIVIVTFFDLSAFVKYGFKTSNSGLTSRFSISNSSSDFNSKIECLNRILP